MNEAILSRDFFTGQHEKVLSEAKGDKKVISKDDFI